MKMQVSPLCHHLSHHPGPSVGGAFNFLRKAKGNVVKAETVTQTYHFSTQEAERSTVGNQSGLRRDTCL